MPDLEFIDIYDIAEELAFDTAAWYDDMEFDDVLPDEDK